MGIKMTAPATAGSLVVVTATRPPAPDPDADWWTTDDIAAYLGVKAASVRRYKVRGDLPAEDRKIGRTLVWKPVTIIAWNENDRPGQGWRAGSRTVG